MMKLTTLLIEWALTSAFLILTVAALRALLGKRVSASLRYALWAVVLIRLLVPVQLFSLPVPAALSRPDRGPLAETAPPAVVTIVPDATVGEPAITIPQSGEAAADHDITTAPADSTRKSEPVSLSRVLIWLWAAGSTVMLTAFFISNLSFARRLRRAREPLKGADCPLPVYTAQGLPSPCLFGLARPAVYVTPGAADDPAMLRHVLAHEYTHFRHGDHIWNLLRGIALAAHWWNPLVWLAMVLSRRDCELACDEGTIRRLGEGERVAYGRTLLALLTVKPRPTDLLTCATTMARGQKRVFDRVTRIAHTPKRWLWAAVAMVLAAMLACVCAFGSAAGPETADELDSQPPVSASPAPLASSSPAPAVTAPAETPPAVNFHPTVFGDGLDFEFLDTGSKHALRFSNLTWAIARTTEFAFQVERYVFLDLDRDGEEELILEMEGQGGFYILRRMDK